MNSSGGAHEQIELGTPSTGAPEPEIVDTVSIRVLRMRRGRLTLIGRAERNAVVTVSSAEDGEICRVTASRLGIFRCRGRGVQGSSFQVQSSGGGSTTGHATTR